VNWLCNPDFNVIVLGCIYAKGALIFSMLVAPKFITLPVFDRHPRSEILGSSPLLNSFKASNEGKSWWATSILAGV